MVRIKAYKVIFLVLSLLFAFNNANAQNGAEDDLKKAADNFFDEQDYVKALPLFSQLLSLYPKDPNYNYKYGASYLFAKRDKEDAVRYLNFAVSSPNVDPLAFYYLALAQQHNYQFTVAQVNYNKFKQKANAKEVAELEVDRKIDMCKNGLKLLKSMTDIGVLYKKEIRATDFFRSYDLKGIGGKVIVKPDEFKTKLDLKKNETSLIHLGDQPKMAIFSSYGNDGKNGKDIYRVVKLPNGEWSKPASIGDEINSPFDEDYPFLHPDGKTLYFSSKGYNSMGGYDIFKSVRNEETGKWSFPENLDFPINTPDDDILFISDIDNELAFFASSRASIQGELTVYKVKVDPLPSGNSIVKGLFIAESNPAMKSATISVVDVNKDRTYGVYNTDKDNGSYLLVFPGNGGKYKILIETTPNSPIHSAVIELPKLEGFRALKQELRLVGEGDNEKLVVKNLFDESDEFDMTDPLIVENLLKMKAQLNVNMTEEELMASKNTTDTSLELQYNDLSDEELVSTSSKKADKIIEKAKTSRKQVNYTYDLANKKSKEAKVLFAKSLALEKEAEQESDVVAKQTKKKEAEQIKMKAAGLVNETLAALNLARAIESEATEIESDLANVKQTKADITNNISSGNRKEAEANYAELEKIAEAAYMKQSSLETEKKIANDKLTEKEIAYNKARNEVIALTNREREIKGDIDNTEEKLANASKKSEKENLETQIKAFKIDLADIQYDLGVAETNEQQLKTEYESLINTTNSFNNVALAVAENGANSTAPSTTNKLALDNDVIYFEKQGLVGLYPEETSASANNMQTNESALASEENEFDLSAHKEEYTIVNEEGNIIDYNTQYSSELVDADNTNDSYQKSLELAKVNQNWALAIEEEISIKEKQLASSDNLNTKINLKSKIEQLTTLKEAKQKEANKQLAFAEVLSGGNTDVESTSENIEAANITDDTGNIVDYEVEYENKLAELENSTDNSPKIDVYKEWINAIDQEILLQKVTLNEATGDDKVSIENRINELETKKQENEEWVALYESQSEETIAENTSSANTNQNNVEENIANTNIDYSKYDAQVVSETGAVKNYASKFEEELIEAGNIVDQATATAKKEEITQHWINAIDEEITYQNDLLAVTDNENDKEAIKTKINDLNALKNTKQEQVVDYQMALADNTKTTSANNISTIVTNNNPLEYTTATEDKALNVSYNTEYPYRANQANRELENVSTLKQEATTLYAQSEEKINTLTSVSDENERLTIIKESDDLKKQAQNKELEIARVYEKTNKSEFYNNQEAISKVKTGAGNSQNVTIAELLEEEAYAYFGQAADERNKAANASSFTSKETAIQKAYNLELQAIHKQNKAIELYSNNANLDEVYASLPVTNNNPSTTNNAAKQPTTNNTTPTITNNTTTLENENTTTNEAVIYQPLAISLPSDADRNNAKRLEKEAEVLEVKAQVLKDSAETVSKTKEKESLIVQADELISQAKQKRKEAEVYYANADEKQSEDAILMDELNENRSSLSSEEVTVEDEAVLASISAEELSTITNSEEYQTYSEAKKTSRRLIKEAEVDYIKADKYQQEAEDEKALGISLNAIAAGAEGERKTKLLGQIEKLEGMIADNELKATEARVNATSKEKEALAKSKEATSVLANNNEVAQKIKSIEKAATYNEDLLAAANNRVTEPDNTTEEVNTTTNEVIAENIVPDNSLTENETTTEENSIDETITEELADNTSNVEEIGDDIDTSTEEANEAEINTVEENVETNETAFIETEPVNENTLEEETLNENTSVPVNNEELTEPLLNETSTTDPQNVDEIPEVLTNEIFVLTPNKAAYNTNKPIPVAKKLPEGLVFKVQIGAFRNPIPQDHFKGFAPIMAENAGNGITRYTAGFFKSFNMANEAKNSIRSIGYSDAFVVAFYNGKRIGINEARAMMNGEALVTTNENSNILPANTTTTDENNSISIPEAVTNYEEVKDGVSTDVHKIEGVFFTVQVGVYSKPVTADQLSNVTPLNSEKTASGLIKYTSGVYKTLNQANAAKDRIRGLGITDAFVIAYANGNRVGVNEAVGYLESSPNSNTTNNTTSNSAATSTENTSSTPANVPNNSSETTNPSNNEQSIETKNNEPTIGTTNTPSVNNNTTSPTNNVAPSTVHKEPIDQVKIGKALKLEFKVLIGEYTEEVPVEDAAIFLKLSSQGVVNYEEDGKSIYTIGAYPDYPSALDMQLKMKDEGIKKPKVIAFRDGMQIDVDQALKLVKDNNQ